MSRGLRLDLANPEDRALLERKVGKDRIKHLIQEGKTAAARTLSMLDSAQPKEQIKRKGSKYGNRIFKNDEGTWHSEYEYQCWVILKSFQRKGDIQDLKRQVDYPFELNGVYITKYVADFEFKKMIDNELKLFVVDAKSEATRKFQRYKWQCKMMLAWYDIEIKELTKNHTDIQLFISTLN